MIHQVLKYCIALVWLINGLFCKTLGLVPRHQQIVAAILGDQIAPILTPLIGIAETIMAIWIVSGKWSRLNAWTQIVVIATMNILEFLLAPDLLMWQQLNIVFAFGFIVILI